MPLAKPVMGSQQVSRFVLTDDLSDFSTTAWQPPRMTKIDNSKI